MPPLDPTTLVLPAILAMIALAVVMSGTALIFNFRSQRMPAATRLEDVVERLAVTQATLTRKEAELREMNQAISDRDRDAAEVGALKEQLEAVKAELKTLDAARNEIEEVKAEAAEAAGELARVTQELGTRTAELAQVMADLDPERIARLRQEFDELTRERETLMAALPELRAERDAALRALAEARAFEAERAVLQARLEELARQRDEIANLAVQLVDLTSRVTEKRSATAALDEERTRLIARIEALKTEREQIDIARIEALKTEREQIDGTGGTSDDDRLADLTKPPACLAVERDGGGYDAVLPRPLRAEQETDALQRVMRHLEESGLQFSRRTVNAFHTSLKTAVISPLTVLAGISGTGKSQLPRFYADAMGIHFLKIPVQPRWDGPQDLFGFYNYIEKRYKATDLARALVHLDPHNWLQQAEPYRDRMLLVLLDEMNLARVEYYFSEFLSRLEGRPSDEVAIDDDARRPSEIEIDVSRKGQTKRVYAGQNILFVGTINEDESTLSLSDKVLDRANVMRFARPRTLREELPTNLRAHVAEGHVSKSRWTVDWKRSADILARVSRERLLSQISQINDILNELGRPFGHRTAQAMLHYVANYPGEPNDHNRVRFALADQIEQRILPKLRGVVVDEHRQQLLDLADLTDRDLGDGELGEEIRNSITRAGTTNGLFVWRGFNRNP